MNWQDLRAEFPITRQWAYMDHAAVAPLSARANKELVEWATDMAENGEVNEPGWGRRLEAVRQMFGHLLNVDAQDIAFIKNTSEGIGIVAEGFPWKPGDNVVTAEDEYPANIYPWLNLTARGVELRRVSGFDGRIHLDDIKAAIDKRTRIISLSSVEFATGFRNDLDGVGALCRDHGIFFFVDAIQSLGVLALDLTKTPIDFLAADGHKWLLGPEGAGIFYIRRELVEMLHPVGIGWNSVIRSRDFSRIDFKLKPNAGRWESGTLNLAGITALGGSLELLQEIGIPEIEARIMELTDYLCEQAKRASLEVYSSRMTRERSAIVSLKVPQANSHDLVRSCRSAGIIINKRAGRIRVSPHCYNTLAEIDRLVELLSGPE